MKQRIKTLDNLPFQLGRHINHDPRSKQFPAATASQIKTVTHQSHIPVLDQGHIGSCTGNALTSALGHDPLFKGELLNEQVAVKLYSAATQLDPLPGHYPPTDTGSDGLDVCKAGVKLGYLKSYTHTFSFDTMLRALVLQPVIIGTNWYEGMFNPAASGHVKISGQIAGGHEYCAFGIDNTHKRVWFVNSWGTGWGLNGTFYLTYATLQRLLKEKGDVTVPVI